MKSRMRFTCNDFASSHQGGARAHKRRAFTLIELLVVIAIISLLVSILLPSLNRAKDLARNVICMSNIRSLGASMFLYTEEWDGFTPFYNLGVDPWGRGNYSYISWANILSETGFTSGGQTGNGQPALGLYICPTQPNPESRWGSWSDPFPVVGYTFGRNINNLWHASHYGLNTFFSSTNDPDCVYSVDLGYPQYRIRDAEEPSTTFLIGDSSDMSGSGFRPPWGWPHIQCLQLRHGDYDSCNMAMVDGHVEALIDEDYDYSYWYPLSGAIPGT